MGEKVLILAAFWKLRQSPLRAHTLEKISLPVPSVNLVPPSLQGDTAVVESPPHRGHHHLGTFLSASRPVYRNTGSCSGKVGAGRSSWHSGIAACLGTELLPRKDHRTVPLRPSFFAINPCWRICCSRHPTGPPLVDRLSRDKLRPRPRGRIDVDLDDAIAVDLNDHLFLDLDMLEVLLECLLHRLSLVLQLRRMEACL